MLQTNPNLCRTCRFWHRHHEWLGECKRDAQAHPDRPGIEFRWDGDNCREVVLMDTSPTFGCVLWEEENEQKGA